MANIKISALPSQTATTTADIVAIVDSGFTTTSKITLKDLFSNGSLISDPTGNKNLFLAAGSPFNSPSTGSRFLNGSYNSVILAGNGEIDNSRDSVLLGCIEAAGGNTTKISNSGSMFMAASFRSQITGGEQSAVIGSQDINLSAYNAAAVGSAGGTINNGPAIHAGSQGGTINGNRTALIGSEGSTVNSNMSGIYNSYATTVSGNLYNVSLGTYVGTVNALGGAMENGVMIGSREVTIDHQRSSMISASGRTSLYSGTTHVDNIHTFQTETFSVIPAGTVSGAVSVDCTLGTIYTFTLGGNVDVDFLNPRTGQRFIFIVENTTFAVNSIVVNGTPGTVYGKNGSINPSSNAITKYTATYDGTRMFLDEELNFSAI